MQIGMIAGSSPLGVGSGRYLEDPHNLPTIAQRLNDHVERESDLAPVQPADDIGATPLVRAWSLKASPPRLVPPAGRLGGDDPLITLVSTIAR
jgi:hypothetical protein